MCDEYTRTMEPSRALATETLKLERTLSDLVKTICSEETCCFRPSCVALYLCMNKVAISKYADAQAVQAEARQLRRAGKRIAASRTTALRLLVATGMYTIKGKLKPQFR